MVLDKKKIKILYTEEEIISEYGSTIANFDNNFFFSFLKGFTNKYKESIRGRM